MTAPIQILNNGETGGVIRSKINANFAAAVNPEVSLACTTTGDTAIDAVTYANKAINLTITGSVGVSAQLTIATTGWVAGDVLTFRIVSLTTAFGANIKAPANTMTMCTAAM